MRPTAGAVELPKNLSTLSLAGEGVLFTPEQREMLAVIAVVNIDLIPESGVVLRTFNFKIEKPYFEYKVEVKEVEGIMTPEIVLGDLVTGEAQVHFNFTRYNYTRNTGSWTCEVSLKDFCKANKLYSERMERENPSVVVCEVEEKGPRGPKKEKGMSESEKALLEALMGGL